jgi:hypothetical protein
LEGRERQRRFGLDALRHQDLHSLGAGFGLAQQGGLADAGLAAQDEAAATERPCLIEENTDPFPLAISAVEHPGKPRAGRRV